MILADCCSKDNADSTKIVENHLNDNFLNFCIAIPYLIVPPIQGYRDCVCEPQGVAKGIVTKI